MEWVASLTRRRAPRRRTSIGRELLPALSSGQILLAGCTPEKTLATCGDSGYTSAPERGSIHRPQTVCIRVPP